MEESMKRLESRDERASYMRQDGPGMMRRIESAIDSMLRIERDFNLERPTTLRPENL